MRLFIAIGVSEEAYDYFLELQKQIDCDLAKVVFTKTFHLTLKFLGDVDEAKKDKIVELLKKAKSDPFTAGLSNIGVFPDENYIRVVWLGLEPKRKIIELQQKIDNALAGIFPMDKRFHPHITLGRVKFVKDKKKFVEILKEIKVEKKSFEISDFKLIKSTLTPEGAVYEVLNEFKAQAL